MNKIISKTILSLSIGALALTTVGCTDFLTRPPQDGFTDETFWQAEANVQMYAWLNYDTYYGYGNGVGTTAEFYFQSAGAATAVNIADDLCNSTFLTYSASVSTTNTDWKAYYKLIRRCNLMLNRVPKVPMSQAKIDHYMGVAYFFRADTYFRLVQAFGDVPYFNEYLSQSESDKIYVPRTDRNTVMDNVKADLEKAISLMLPSDGGNYNVNKYTAHALMTRIGIYEGTYRKYNNKGDGAAFLTAAKTSAEAVMTGGYALGAAGSWKALYNSVDLTGSKEVILVKRYLPSVLMHSVQAFTNTSSTIHGMSKSAIDNYVCKDGLPINQSPLYKGDNTIVDVTKDRDPRLPATINPTTLGTTDVTYKGLTSSTGYVIELYNNPATTGSAVTTTGQNHIDAPVFTLTEVLLNYAEACAELGTATQADLDKSINLIRDRAGITRLTMSGSDVMAGATVINDPKRVDPILEASPVSPLIWEIRRERRSELMTWTYLRAGDLMRWNRGIYTDMVKNPDCAKGARLVGITPDKVRVDENGYILPYAATASRVFVTPKNLFNSIPSNDINLYKAEGVELSQNEGW